MVSDDGGIIYGRRKSRSEFSKVADQGDGRDAGLLFGAELVDFDMVLPFAEQDLAHGLHHLGDLNPFGTPDVARIAGCANPDGFGFEKLLLESELGVANDLVGKDVHLTHGRTAGRTLAALVAGQQVLAADLFYFSDKIIPDLFSGDVRSHLSFSLSGLKGSILNIKWILKAKMTLQ
jgi:hypothetical protein